MTTYRRRFTVAQLVIIGLIGLLSLQLTGLSCLHEWFVVAVPDRVQVISASSHEGTEATQERLDACPCHAAIAQGEGLPPSEAFHLTGTIFHTPVDYVSPMIALLFHPPISA